MAIQNEEKVTKGGDISQVREKVGVVEKNAILNNLLPLLGQAFFVSLA